MASALIVEIPEAEPAVGGHRAELDPSARLGVPAHVTVLFPFVPADRIDAATETRLERLFAGVRSFGFRMDRTAWFGEEVLWLAASDPRPFRSLTERVHAAFPDFPPFEGRHDEVVPHLTVAHAVELERMRAAERDVHRRLPIHGRVEEVTLLTQAAPAGPWQRARTFGLGG